MSGTKDRVEGEARYERKFIAEGVHPAQIERLVLSHAAIFRETYPARIVNSLYLDTPDLKDYFDHVHGLWERSKTRIRWYGVARHQCIAPSLERKLKHGLVGVKRSQALSLETGGANGHGWVERLHGALVSLDPCCESVLTRIPTVCSRYARQYYASADGRYRLTVDTVLEVCRASECGNSMRWARVRLPGAIIELKYKVAYAEQADSIAASLPFRYARYSKYVAALQQLGAV